MGWLRAQVLVIRAQHVVVVVDGEPLDGRGKFGQLKVLVDGGISVRDDQAHAHDFAVGQFHVERHRIHELRIYAGLHQLEMNFPSVAARRKVAFKMIRGQIGAVDVFAEEPIHGVRAFEVHAGKACVFPRRL